MAYPAAVAAEAQLLIAAIDAMLMWQGGSGAAIQR